MAANERTIRARVEAIYNRPESDFEERNAYDDYLEAREDIIFNLTEGVDLAATEAKLSAYAAANATSIAAHAAAKAEAVRQQDETDAPPAPPEDAAADPPRAYTAAPLAPAAPAAPPAPVAAPPVAAGPLTDDAMRAMGLASGWDPRGARRAAVRDALATLFCF